MEPKRKTQLIVAASVIAGLYFSPAIMNMARHTLIVRNQGYAEQPTPSKPSPAVPMPANVPAAVANPLADTPADPAYSAMLGKYMGGAILKTRECKGNLELGSNPAKPDQFTGYITIVCYAPFTHKEAMPFLSTDPVTAIGTESTPASAILSGKVVNGVIQLHADKTIQTLADGCPITGISISPFGDNQIAVDWQEGTCQGGQLIFHKA